MRIALLQDRLAAFCAIAMLAASAVFLAALASSGARMARAYEQLAQSQERIYVLEDRKAKAEAQLRLQQRAVLDRTPEILRLGTRAEAHLENNRATEILKVLASSSALELKVEAAQTHLLSEGPLASSESSIVATGDWSALSNFISEASDALPGRQLRQAKIIVAEHADAPAQITIDLAAPYFEEQDEKNVTNSSQQ